MQRDPALASSSLLSVLLMTIHLADDIVRGMSPGGMVNVVGLALFVAWACGATVLGDRRSGHVIMLLGGCLGAAVPVIHLRGAGLGGTIAASDGGFLFIWTLVALGVSSALSALLAVRGLWRARPAVGG